MGVAAASGFDETTAAGTKLGQLTPSIDNKSGARLTRPTMNVMSAQYDRISLRKSQRHTKIPQRNPESALASFKDFQRESMMEREARHQSLGSCGGQQEEEDPMSLLKVNNLSTSSDDGGAGQTNFNQVD